MPTTAKTIATKSEGENEEALRLRKRSEKRNLPGMLKYTISALLEQLSTRFGGRAISLECFHLGWMSLPQTVPFKSILNILRVGRVQITLPAALAIDIQ